MINSKEYKKLLSFFCLKKNVLINHEDPEKFINLLDNIREHYKLWHKEMHYWRVYPPYDLTKARLLFIELREICKSANIEYSYIDPKSEQGKKFGIYCKFYYNNEDITDLIHIIQKT